LSTCYVQVRIIYLFWQLLPSLPHCSNAIHLCRVVTSEICLLYRSYSSSLLLIQKKKQQICLWCLVNSLHKVGTPK
jgi:hypothetical protein